MAKAENHQAICDSRQNPTPDKHEAPVNEGEGQKQQGIAGRIPGNLMAADLKGHMLLIDASVVIENRAVLKSIGSGKICRFVHDRARRRVIDQENDREKKEGRQ